MNEVTLKQLQELGDKGFKAQVEAQEYKDEADRLLKEFRELLNKASQDVRRRYYGLEE